MIERVRQAGQGAVQPFPGASADRGRENGSAFGAMLELQMGRRAGAQVNFSKHALARAEERGIELSPALMDKLADSVERAQEKGATNILAFDETQAFIINIPYSRVITMMSQDEMRKNIFTNIDGAVLL